VDSNMTSVGSFSSSLFGIGGRESGNARYDINLTLPYRAVSFEITSFEAIPGNSSTAIEPGLLSVFFTDATSQSLPINGNATGANIFFGVVSDTPISSIRWAEADEGNGGSEETALDDFRVRLVPEPSTGILCCSMMLITLLAGRRRQAG
jgi:hypothetical protein